MPAPVYSHRFLEGHAGAEPLYTVPAGYRAVVRWLTAFNGSALVPEGFQFIMSDLNVTITQTSILPGESFSQELRVVFNEGQDMTVSNGSDIDFTVSGYLLTLP